MVLLAIYSSFLRPDDIFVLEADIVDPVADQIARLIWAEWSSDFAQSNITRSRLELLYADPPLPKDPRSQEAYSQRVTEWQQRDALRKLQADERIDQLPKCGDTEFQFVLRIKPEQPPVPPAEQAHNVAVRNAQAAPAPSSVSKDAKMFLSEQKKHPIYNGRALNRDSSPIALYSHAFATLKDDLANPTAIEPDAAREVATGKLFTAAVQLYPSEKARQEVMIPLLEKVLDVTFEQFVVCTKEGSLNKDTEADALARVDGVNGGIFMLVELKNEPGSSGHGGWQGPLTLQKFISHSSHSMIRNASCCPCLLISLEGPYICIAGAVLVDVLIVQPFTDYIYLGGDPFTSQRITEVAGIFSAVAKAARSLQAHYRALVPRSTTLFSRLFPQPVYIDDAPKKALEYTARLDYEGREKGDYRRSLFLAKYGGGGDDDDGNGTGQQVVVKFCERYNARAHQLLADLGLAPALYFCKKVRGDMSMVVMEFVEGRNAHYEFFQRPLPQDVLDDVRHAVDALHDANMVFGDLRRPNILVVPLVPDASGSAPKETAAKRYKTLLVDFDWAGIDEQTRYPPLLNDSGDIDWAIGVGPRAVMKKAHDKHMLEKLKLHTF